MKNVLIVDSILSTAAFLAAPAASPINRARKAKENTNMTDQADDWMLPVFELLVGALFVGIFWGAAITATIEHFR